MPTNGHTARSAAMTPPPVHRYNTRVKLAGRVAIVTGGAVGIGRVYVRRLLAEGARVLIGDIVDATDALRELAGRGEVRSVTVDVASATSAQAMTDEAVRVFGRLDILVNNAAVFATLKPQPFDAIPEAEWDRVMAVNVKGIWNCAKAVVPAMKAQGGGRIVNIAVNALAPGLTLSDSVLRNPEITAFQAAAVMQSRAFKREETPEDLEGALVFLASSESAFMTGQTVVVDGGSIFL